MSIRTSGGFTLLETVVALGLLAVSTLAIAQALGAALAYGRAADAARRAIAVAAALADTFDQRFEYPAGWNLVGVPGQDGLPGTADDAPAGGTGAACERRVVYPPGGDEWVWVEASCVLTSGSPSPVDVGGRLARSAALVRWR